MLELVLARLIRTVDAAIIIRWVSERSYTPLTLRNSTSHRLLSPQGAWFGVRGVVP